MRGNRKMRHERSGKITLYAIIAVCFLFFACDGNPWMKSLTAHLFCDTCGKANENCICVDEPPPSEAKAITGFTFASPPATGMIDEGAKTISVTVPYGTVVTSLTPTVIHTGASYSPTGPQNFAGPVTYTVSAADGSTQNYT